MKRSTSSPAWPSGRAYLLVDKKVPITEKPPRRSGSGAPPADLWEVSGVPVTRSPRGPLCLPVGLSSSAAGPDSGCSRVFLPQCGQCVVPDWGWEPPQVSREDASCHVPDIPVNQDSRDRHRIFLPDRWFPWCCGPTPTKNEASCSPFLDTDTLLLRQDADCASCRDVDNVAR